jgi:phosphoribosylanthranilate isomerase
MQPDSTILANDLIQVAGIIDREEAEMLVRCGVKYLGFPLRLPVHREDLSEDEASRIILTLEPPSFGVLITYLDRSDEIAVFCEQLGARIVQIHGDIELRELKKLKRLNPDLTIIKSLVVGLHADKALELMIEESSSYVDAYITDTFDPKTGAAGATGMMHDWAVSRRLVKLSKRPVIIAGGLTPENVKSAIEETRPAGVDVHTGVENASGRKDQAKVEKFIHEAEAGFRTLRTRGGLQRARSDFESAKRK